MIPKNIFFFYDTGYDSLHPKLKENIQFVKNQNPDYNVKVYDTKTFREYLKTKGSNYLSCFNSINSNMPAVLADYFRVIILYFEGGIYLDVKSNAKIPFNQFIKEQDKVWVVNGYTPNQWETAFIASEPNNIIMKDCIDLFNNRIENYHEYIRTVKFQLRQSRHNLVKFIAPGAFSIIIEKHIDLFDTYGYHSESLDIHLNLFIKGNWKTHQKLYTKPHYSKVKEHLVIRRKIVILTIERRLHLAKATKQSLLDVGVKENQIEIIIGYDKLDYPDMEKQYHLVTKAFIEKVLQYALDNETSIYYTQCGTLFNVNPFEIELQEDKINWLGYLRNRKDYIVGTKLVYLPINICKDMLNTPPPMARDDRYIRNYGIKNNCLVVADKSYIHLQDYPSDWGTKH